MEDMENWKITLSALDKRQDFCHTIEELSPLFPHLLLQTTSFADALCLLVPALLLVLSHCQQLFFLSLSQVASLTDVPLNMGSIALPHILFD